MSVINAENSRPLRPRIVTGPRNGWLWNNFQIDQPLAFMPHRSPDAVIARIATTNDHNMFVLRIDELAVEQLRIEQTFGIRVQEFHGHMNSFEGPSRNRQITRRC